MTTPTVFGFDDYKLYVRERFAASSHRGRGQMRLIAEHLRVHSTLVSHVLGGEKDFTLEQTVGLAEYFGLGELETDYLLALVELCRSGSDHLKAVVRRRLARLRDDFQQLEKRLPRDRTLADEDKAIFYSSWNYSAVRLATSLPSTRSDATIAAALGIPLGRVQRILDFLLDKGLVPPLSEFAG